MKCNKKGKSNVIKEKKIILLSNTTKIGSSNYSTLGNQVGEYDLGNIGYLNLTVDNITLDKTKDDLVIPSKINNSGTVKEVGVYSGGFINSCRKLFFPDTVFKIDYNTISKIKCYEYVRFPNSKLGFLYISPENFYADFILEQETDSAPKSLLLKGKDYYYFPYTEVTFTSSTRWNPGTLNYQSWNWQTNFTDLYNQGLSDKNSTEWKQYSSVLSTFSEKEAYFRIE